jgi:3-hydroxyisobutyrate dehydrogenase-like beta-hydroxyacid dehydrogenase
MLAGYAQSPILEMQGRRMLRHDFAPGGKARFHLKDIATISHLAHEAGIELPAFRAAATQIERLIEHGGGDLDNSAIVTMIERPPSTQLDN